jgi:uncharacterized protein
VSSATDLYNIARCKHRVFLDRSGPVSERLAPPAEALRLREEGIEHERLVIEGLDVTIVPPGGSIADRAARTAALMAAGAPLIYHGMLTQRDLTGEPDLLRRVERESSFGSFGYEPVDVKNGRATKSTKSTVVKAEYAMQLLAYAELLGHAQGWRPERGWIVDRHQSWQEVDLTLNLEAYAEARLVLQMIERGTSSTGPGWKTACAQCGWRDKCWEELVAGDDLTTLPDIGEPKREKLWTIGIRTVADLAAADPNHIASTKGLGQRARLWPLRARAVKTGLPAKRGPWVPTVADFEISYDVENLTGGNVYLHGLLVRPMAARKRGTPGFVESDYGTFEPICAEYPETEADVWARFLAKLVDLETRGTYVTYIYSPHERGVLRRLRGTYGGSPALDRFEASIVDLRRIVVDSVIFPTDGNGLKTIAAYVDFHWRDPDPGGAQSITWWTSYWANPEQHLVARSRVLEYNEDDVRATFAVRDWLEQFCAVTGEA